MSPTQLSAYIIRKKASLTWFNDFITDQGNHKRCFFRKKPN